MRGVHQQIQRELTGASAQVGAAAGRQVGQGFASGLQQAAGRGVEVLAKGTAAAATAAAATVAASLVKGWDRLTTIQDATAALTISLQSSADAGALLGDVLDTVRGTPFNLDQFAQAAQQMVGMGIEAEKVPGYLEAIGEASATQGGRASEFAGRLSTVFGQIASSGQVQLADLWRISDTGVNALAILANNFGVSRDAMKDMISEGAVPAGEALDALAKGILEGSDGPAGATIALAGTMDALRKTVSGSVAGISPAMARLGAAFLEPFSPAVVAGANGLTDSLDVLAVKAGELAQSIASSDAFEQFVDFLGEVPDIVEDVVDGFDRFGPALAGITTGLAAFGAQSFTKNIPGLKGLAGAFNPVLLGLAAVTAASPEAREALAGVVAEVIPLVAELVDDLMPVLTDLSEIAGEVLPPAFELFGAGLTAAVAVATPLAGIVADLTGFLADNEAVVIAAASAWLAFGNAARVAQAAAVSAKVWSGVGKALDAVAIGAYSALGAMRDMDGVIAKVDKALLRNVTGAQALTGALVGIGVGAGVATQVLNDWADAGEQRAAEFLKDFEFDGSTMQSSVAGLNDLNDEIQRLNDLQRSGSTDFAEDERIEAQIVALREEYRLLSDDTDAAFKGAQDLMKEFGLSAQDLQRILAEEDVTFVDAFDDAGNAIPAVLDRIRESMRGVATVSELVTDNMEEQLEAARNIFDQQRSVSSAEEGVADAVREVSDAMQAASDARRAAVRDGEDMRRAQEGVADAERSLASAQRESRQAQVDLNDAREAAADRLRDLQFGAEGAALSEEAARMALSEARKDLFFASSGERARADLRVRQAELALREAQARREESEGELTDAQQAGIEGSDQVIAAKERIRTTAEAEAEAQRRVGEATREVSEVQKRAAEEAVIAAEQRVAADERVEEAVKNLTEKQLELVESQSELAGTTEGAAAANGILVDGFADIASSLDPANPLRRYLDEYIVRLTALRDLNEQSQREYVAGGWGGVRIVENADGGINHYAAGGIHKAVGPNGVLRFAEARTGGEAFIPRLGINYDRARRLLEVAAGWHGLGIIDKKQQPPAFAMGGIAQYEMAGGGRSGGRSNRRTAGDITIVAPPDTNAMVDRLTWELI